ncbi:TraB/GumN family protein [Flavobacterium sp. SUN052]|uniref:TraB/GumN family protein n=1 Tax=Flavobacterium sp. SUN052 TaxID=3002441 RepID=UPI00237DB6FA|nr:TraB/GumN family protein [Flavobacterium sp. SUN052]MEC4003253.1 TraB/GumN family protein [Flavobacterium sp. SUN052]
MKKSLLLSFFFCTTLIFAQKEKTLFWEISGNGLAKNSYLYGTMHVSDKVSYHLSDAFFKNLLNADIVSNESDPETWDDILSLVRTNELESPYNFYSSFYLKPLKSKEINAAFINENYFSNMLSGIEGAQADFQENTVLDMFIYQTGKKYKKRIVGLESAKGSMLSIMKIKQDEAKPDDKNIEKLMKIIKNGNFNETLKSFYREKDIVMLDSIYKLMMSKKAHEVMIINRNQVMTRSIDSLAKTGSLFSAVGAAHLAGKGGIIQLLRDKGYTVTPIVDVISENGQKQKKAIEEFFPNPGFTVTATADEMVKMPLNKKIIPSKENIGSPDFTNGGTINIKRIPLNQFLNKKNELFNPKSLDSLFFENIAGEISEKTFFKEENYVGYDIKNTTKNGNSQHWRFYITPLEIVAISMTGSGNYTKQFDKEIFDNIKIKPFKNSWDKIAPKKGGFTVDVPSFNSVYGNSDELSNVEIQAYDAAEKAYYFVTERTLNNTNLLEENEFELKQIQYEFYLQHDIDSTNTVYDKVKKTVQSESKIGNQKIKLKSVINGTKYYLLGTVNSSDSNSNRFFDSFKEEKFNYSEKTKIFSDTIAKFKIEIPEKENESLFLELNKDDDKDKNKFLSKSIDYTFHSQSGQEVALEYYKYHKYESIQNLDSVKVNFRRLFLKEENNTKFEYDDEGNNNYDDEYSSSSISLSNFSFNSKKGFSESLWFKMMQKEDEKYEIISESTSYDKEKNSHVFEALVSRPSASQAIKYKIFFNEDSNTQLTALVPKNYKNDDAFIEKTFNSLVFTDKNKTSVFDDKLQLFIEDANSEKDTIRFSALKSVYELKVDKKDIDTVTNFLNTFQFKDNESYTIKVLIEKLGEIQDEKIIPYLEELYKKEGTKTLIQIGVLNALTNQKSKIAYKKIADLLEYDLPLSDNQYEISNLFSQFQDDLENSKVLFPKIFQFYSIKEYNEPVINFCNKLFDSNLVSSKKLNSFKKIINTNAKLEYKRILSWKEKNPIEDEDEIKTIATKTIQAVTEKIEEITDETVNEPAVADYSEEVETSDAPVEDLLNYMSLLSNFTEDDATKSLFEKIKSLNIPQLNVELIRLGILNNTLLQDEIEEALNNSKTRFITIQLLLNKNKTELLKTISDEEIAKSAVINFEGLRDKDAISLISQQIVDFNGKEVTYYFFEIAKKVKDDEVVKKELYPIAFVNDNKKINPLAYRSFGSESIEETDDIAKKCQAIIIKNLNQKHFRASFKKQEDENQNSYLGDY